MGRSGILILICMLIAGNLRSQQSYDLHQVDSATYASYLEGNWNKVIDQGKIALEKGIDFLYLRQRMAIAYYNKRNYRAASRQLSSAYKFSPENAVTLEYQYYSYLFSGRYQEAQFLAGSLDKNLREKTGIQKPPFFSLINAEAGVELSNNTEQNSFGQLPGGQSLRWQDLYGNSIYGHLGFIMHLHPRINLYMGYSYLSISKKAEFQYAWGEPDSIVEYDWGFAKYFPSNPIMEYQHYDYTLRQNGYYLRSDLYLGKGWSLSPAIHYVNVNTYSTSIKDNSQLVKDTAYYVTEIDSAAYFFYERLDYTMNASPLTLNNVVLSLGINKQVSVFNLGLFGSWSNLNDENQLQFGLSATYYPLGNLNLYGNTTMKGLSEEDDFRAIFRQLIGFKVTSFLWAEAFGEFGNLRGSNEFNAYIVYNLTDDINLKTGASLIFVVSPKLRLSARYQYLEKTGFRYVSGQQAGGQTQWIEEFEYSNQSFIGGLLWIF